MNADRVISKINHDMNDFNESGSREDKACAEGLRRARTYVQQEVLKRKILTHDQQVVLESLKHYYSKSNYYDIRAGKEPMQAVDRMLMEAESDATGLSDVYYRLTEKQQFQVLAAFAEWGLSNL